MVKQDKFAQRHLGVSELSSEKMLAEVGYSSIDELIDDAVPQNIKLAKELDLPEAVSEYQFLKQLKEIASKNKVFKSYIGLGYYECIIPPVIQRNILENPGWYTAYTPYQAEISQGRMEALLNFQTMVNDLTGMELANASLLDESTAAAEAMIMLFNLRDRAAVKNGVNKFLISEKCFPQTIEVLKTRALPLGIDVVIGNHEEFDVNEQFFGTILQYPDVEGAVIDYKNFTSRMHDIGAKVVVTADILSLVLLNPPGEWGADVVVGSTQRLGVPMGYGGPHAAYFATREEFKRYIPGRIIGVSKDSHGKPALRMALQTREQHIKRDKATSNICTAQALLAVMAGMYVVYHGSEGLKRIASNIHFLALTLQKALKELKIDVTDNFFDTLKITRVPQNLREIAESENVNFRYIDGENVSITINETNTLEDILQIVQIFARSLGVDTPKLKEITTIEIDSNCLRETSVLTHEVFNKYRSETEMMRYIKHLENKDFSLTHGMIPLGSCTMKLNAASQLMPLTWEEFSSLHPFAPVDQTKGYQQIFNELDEYLSEITGFSKVSFQPNSGAQGEYAGLMVIRAYHHSRGDFNRNIALIPASAHGTNPASAVMAGMKVVVVKTDENGNIDVADLTEKAEKHKDNLSALMVTYPSTHGVFEESIIRINEIIHQFGGQVYMDGANMNAQVGLTSPGSIGADVCHLNLHKTFAIPHGGGGPGMGPIGVAEHLVPFLPAHPLVKTGGENGISSIAAAPWSSALILLISYGYIKMLGKNGVVQSTKIAILGANYIKEKLKGVYDILYLGQNGNVAHELILDCRNFKKDTEIGVEDIAKRLMDYGFHAPTVSFPVPGTLMIEPTESESKEELDRFIEAMISIRKEIELIEQGIFDKESNPLKNAPHKLEELVDENWNHPYSKELAVFPVKSLRQNKFWPSTGRIDNAYGDRNLICSCIPIEEYA